MTVNGAKFDLLSIVGSKLSQGRAHYPAVEGRHEVVALRGAQECERRDDAAVLIPHAQQQLEFPFYGLSFSHISGAAGSQPPEHTTLPSRS
jgi:hypothetical protein